MTARLDPTGKPRPSAMRAYVELRHLILSGECAPGDWITERWLAERLSAKLAEVRRALTRLEAEGLIRRGPLGTQIHEVTEQEIADQYEIRAALEIFVLRTLAGRLTAPQVGRLRENLQEQEANTRTRNVDLAVQLDADFHSLFSEFLGNQEILRVLGHLRDKMRRVITRVFVLNPERIRTSYQEHCGIADAVQQGDAALAVRRIEEHLQFGKQCLLSPR